MTKTTPGLNHILEKIQDNRDFPVLSQSISNINQLTQVDNKDVNQIADIIIQDFGLTSKILKVVNSAFYGRFSGHIGTISRAIVVLGIETVRSLAASLIFFEHIEDKKHAERLRELVSASLFSGIVARELTDNPDIEQKENYFLTALLHNLGDILIAFYLPEEDDQIKQKVMKSNISHPVAQQAVLNTNADEIAVAIASNWSFPETLVESLPAWPANTEPTTKQDHYRLVADFSTEVTQTIIEQGLDDDTAITAIAEKYDKLLDLDLKTIKKTVAKATTEFNHIGESMPGDISHQFMRRINGGELESTTTSSSTPKLNDTLDAIAQTPAEDAESIMMDGLSEVTSMLVSDSKLTEVFSVVLETIYRAMGFDKVILAVHSKKTNEFIGRLGFGDKALAFSKRFKMSAVYENTIFHAVMKNNVDVYISDATDKKIQADLPDWFKSISDAGCFLLLPIIINKKPIGLIYAEHKNINGLNIDKKKLSLLKSLRNQIVLACRSGS